MDNIYNRMFASKKGSPLKQDGSTPKNEASFNFGAQETPIPTKKRDSIAWADFKKPYLKKSGGKAEWNREKREFYNNKGKIEMIPTGDDDAPNTTGIDPKHLGSNQK